jgi:hypothetical protein
MSRKIRVGMKQALQIERFEIHHPFCSAIDKR